ncbi:hypothetical protein PTQ27_04595 [Mannheimia sp. AT1]|uniref:DUF7210 domain-containing protein n=1 Tax=Mannheimia cairinae TaxID=3025936 RepID=A0ABT5MNJ8_9PAST|nr:hypothetical protein [Mannheimia cairinae]MDD0823754.1 hypothetical protein [Mannheimia cairinae]MDD0825314.1 hypothetical protein [Mannheimia cairinae]
MPKFIVLNTPILHNGKRYEVGAEIELTAEQAENNAINLQVILEEPKVPKQPKEPKPPKNGTPEDEQKLEENGSIVTDEDVKLAEENIAEAEKTKGNKR